MNRIGVGVSYLSGCSLAAALVHAVARYKYHYQTKESLPSLMADIRGSQDPRRVTQGSVCTASREVDGISLRSSVNGHEPVEWV